MSYGPFLGGKRVCIGKTLAENFAKIVIPIVISKFDFSFSNPIYYTQKPQNAATEDSHLLSVIVKTH
jgi:cytochrome P450